MHEEKKLLLGTYLFNKICQISQKRLPNLTVPTVPPCPQKQKKCEHHLARQKSIHFSLLHGWSQGGRAWTTICKSNYGLPLGHNPPTSVKIPQPGALQEVRGPPKIVMMTSINLVLGRRPPRVWQKNGHSFVKGR